MEEVIPSSKLQLLISLMEALPAEDTYTWNPRSSCPRCGEPTNQDLCTICQLTDWYAGAQEKEEMEILELDAAENP
jgi:hypothetical protein